MKALFTILLTLIATTAMAEQKFCEVEMEYPYSTEEIQGKSYVNSPSGPILAITKSEIEELINSRLMKKGYKLSKNNGPRRISISFSYYDDENNGEPEFAGADIGFKATSTYVGNKATPGLFSQMFDSEKEQIQKLTKNIIKDFAKRLPSPGHCY